MRFPSRTTFLLTVFATLVACGDAARTAPTPNEKVVVAPPVAPEAPPPAPPPTPPPPLPPLPPPYPDITSPAQAGWPAVQTELPRYTLRFDDDAYRRLEQNRDVDDYSVPAVFTAAGRVYKVDVQFRGRSTRHVAKKSFQIRFEDGVRFRGVKRLELLASWRDGGHLSEKLWYDLAAAAGVRASRAEYVLLSVEHGGGDFEHTGIRDPAFQDAVYLQIEAVTKDFLSAHGFDEDSDIYRCGMHDCELGDGPLRSYQERWVKRTNESQPWTGLERFLRGVNRTAPTAFTSWAERNVDLDGYFQWLAVQDAAAVHLHQDSRSFLVQDAHTGKWSYVPWDLNNVFSVPDRNHVNGTRQGTSRSSRPLLTFTAYDEVSWQEYLERQTFWPDMAPAWNTLSTRLVADPRFADRYADTLEHLLQHTFRPEQVCQRLYETAALLAPHQRRETELVGWNYNVFGNERTPEGYYSFVDERFISPTSRTGGQPFSAWWLCKFVTERHAYLKDALKRFRAQHGRGALVVQGVGRDAQGAAWVELINRGTDLVDLGGLFLSGTHRSSQQWALPAKTLEPGGTIRLTEGDPLEPLHLGITIDSERPELGLFGQDGHTPIDLWWLPSLQAGEAYVRPAPDEPPERCNE